MQVDVGNVVGKYIVTITHLRKTLSGLHFSVLDIIPPSPFLFTANDLYDLKTYTKKSIALLHCNKPLFLKSLLSGCLNKAKFWI